METCFNYTDGSNMAYFSSDERKWINRIHKWAEERPDEVRIEKEPDENDRCIYARVPASWLKVRYPKKMNFTEEHLNALTEQVRTLSRTKR